MIRDKLYTNIKPPGGFSDSRCFPKSLPAACQCIPFGRGSQRDKKCWPPFPAGFCSGSRLGVGEFGEAPTEWSVELF